jgi:hypothetical protein
MMEDPSKEIGVVLNLLESLRGKSQVQEFLEEQDTPHSGTWEKVRARIRTGTKTGNLNVEALVSLLEEIEEHGNQYVFIYDIDLEKAGKSLDPASVSEALTANERRSILNTVRIIEDPPENATLISVRTTSNPIKVKWIEKRLLRRHIGETIRGYQLTIQYHLEPARAIDSAVMSREKKRAYLCVQRVETGIREYKVHLKDMVDRLKRFLDPESLIPYDLGKLMKDLANKSVPEARLRRHQARDQNGRLFDATSANETDDLYSGGGIYDAARQHYSGSLTDLHVNVYWKPNGAELKREIHTIFPYRNFANAVVFTQRCSKIERDYVVSRIEAIAKK